MRHVSSLADAFSSVSLSHASSCMHTHVLGTRALRVTLPIPPSLLHLPLCPPPPLPFSRLFFFFILARLAPSGRALFHRCPSPLPRSSNLPIVCFRRIRPAVMDSRSAHGHLILPSANRNCNRGIFSSPPERVEHGCSPGRLYPLTVSYLLDSRMHHLRTAWDEQQSFQFQIELPAVFYRSCATPLPGLLGRLNSH